MAGYFLESLEDAKEKAKAENKVVYVDFFNPGWGGCKELDSSVYPNKDIEEFLIKNTIPVKLNITITDNIKLAKEFNVAWTPGILITSLRDGKKLVVDFKTYGYLPANDFINALKIGLGLSYFHQGLLDKSEQFLDDVVKSAASSIWEPEALYWLGVVRYKQKGSPEPLLQQWRTLLSKYPNTEWAKKAEFIKK